MPKYRVFAIASASWLLGEYEADTKEKAVEMAYEDDQRNEPGLCHHCAGEIELGDSYDEDVFEVD